MRSRNKNGFTIIEVLIVTVIIAILATITIVAYTKVQGDARNNTRKGNALTIANALEAYYNKNGEYPSVRSLVNSYPANTGSSIASFLSISASTLVNPQMPSGATNSLSSVSPPANDYITYTGASSVNASDCQNSLTGGCDSFTLQYNQEAGAVVTITSRHNGRSTSYGSTPDAVPAPTLSATSLGANAVATATATACENAGLTAKFSYQYQANGGAWSGYGSWTTSNTYSIPGSQGYTYTFQAMTRCDNGPIAGQSSPASNTASTVFPVTTPSTPVVTVAQNGANVQATVATVTCASGATPLYAYKSQTNGGAWSSFSSWSSLTTASQTGTQGVLYGYTFEAECTANGVNSAVATSSPVSFMYPISAPTMPAVTMSTSGSTTTWSWTGATCPAGTSAQYQEDDNMDGSAGYDSGWFGPYSVTSSPWSTSQEGYQYTESFQAQCYNANGASPWSSNTSSGSYIRSVTAPGGATGFSASLSSDRKTITYNWTWPSCSSGIQQQDSRSARFLNNGWGAWSAQGWWATTWGLVWTNPYPTTPAPMPSGSQAQMEVRYICVNTDTGRQSAWGPTIQSPIFTAP